MRTWLLILLLTGLARAAVWPFPYTQKRLPNGLQLVVVPTDEHELISLQIVMRVGSRNEVEPGRSGFAHFFEHMMFRGTPTWPPEKARPMLQRLGVDANAWTSDDETVFHSTFGKDSLGPILDYEADRFQHLEYTPADVKTESQAVLGEYNKNAADPEEKLQEVLQDTAFVRHTYKHTTMGFLRDVQAMPNEYDYSRTFFRRFYRPQNAILVLAGAVTAETATPLVEKSFGAWQASSEPVPPIPAEPPQRKPRQASVKWPSATLPWVVVAYKVPAFNPDSIDSAVLRVIPALTFADTSPFYQRYLLDEKRIDQLDPMFPSRRDPYLAAVGARLRSAREIEPVRAALTAEFEGLGRARLDPARLAAVKSRLKYTFLGQLDNCEAVAAALVPYLSLTGTPASVDQLFARIDALQPADIQRVARRLFRPETRTVVVLR